MEQVFCLFVGESLSASTVLGAEGPVADGRQGPALTEIYKLGWSRGNGY